MSLRLISVVSEHVNREDPSAQIIAHCDWDERLDKAADLVGGLLYDENGNAYYQSPKEYPLAKGIFVSNVEITPIGDFNDKGDVDYQTAKLSIDYAGLKIIDPSAVDGIGLCEIGLQCSGEELALPDGSFRWATDQELLGDGDFKPSKTFPYLEFSLKFGYGADPKLSWAAWLIGYLNLNDLPIEGSAFGGVINWQDTFRPGMVMFMGSTVEKGTNCQGMPCFIRDMKFGVRINVNDETASDGVWGWNTLYRPKTGKFEYVQTETGQPLYSGADFSPLFKIKSEQGG